ncbi:hypothetical protein Geob_2415 [Geotalea daltonii FRC-32]|uniref:Uncharacterized protein n=1 Tax=Geotalea daltonii (strain DSM 22248 / JCM 15807 / FRC-32) TaxID=316067 RepID=B9LZY8_GEODF|nr:DUF190 domain-containing protein [Geotalea daltonii]ACM20768.1 hypothetical protein Geob_2415 [Geotalea daltonii FRC-32]
MSDDESVVIKEYGQLRIYMTARDKVKATTNLQRFFGRSLYEDIIEAAKQDGIFSAYAYLMHSGYIPNGKIETGKLSEYHNSSLNLYIELISLREEIELFVKKHSGLLKDKAMVYKPIEGWSFGSCDTIAD